MVKRLALIFVVVMMVACSVTSKLSHKYVGKGVELLYKEMGTPKSISKLANGNSLYAFEKETFVRSTEIGTGRGTLDPRISPSFAKVETFLFEVNNEGIIVDTEYEKRIDQ
jgi:hypothetical protein